MPIYERLCISPLSSPTPCEEGLRLGGPRNESSGGARSVPTPLLFVRDETMAERGRIDPGAAPVAMATDTRPTGDKRLTASPLSQHTGTDIKELRVLTTRMTVLRSTKTQDSVRAPGLKPLLEWLRHSQESEMDVGMRDSTAYNQLFNGSDISEAEFRRNIPAFVQALRGAIPDGTKKDRYKNVSVCSGVVLMEAADDQSSLSGGGGSSCPEEGYILVRVQVPELNVQKCLQFPRDQLVWDVKQQCLAALPKVRSRRSERACWDGRAPPRR
uniref:Uncharacterized protein n=1 Tax=Timema shepardi TaxID=629360 RepID=A0A7R9B7M2_TIMSH|nr:unnamed protein product [Timema shepardi]